MGNQVLIFIKLSFERNGCIYFYTSFIITLLFSNYNKLKKLINAYSRVFGTIL